jgi:tetratricopeptide (TPR) repeat protein
MMKRIRAALAIFISYAFISCSGAPSPKEEETAQKNQAAEYAESGNRYFNDGLYEQALSFFRLSLSYNGSVFYERGVIESYNSIGKTYIAMSLPDKALDSFNAALAMAREINDKELVAVCYTHKAELLIFQKKNDEALALLEDALEMKNAVSRPRLAVVYHDLGIVYRRLGNTDLAIVQFENALSINLSIKNFHEVASNYYMLSSSYSEKGDIAKALDACRKALDTDKKFENSLGIMTDCYALGILSMKAGDEEVAYGYFKDGLLVCDSILAIRPAANVEAQKKVLLDSLIPLSQRIEGEGVASEYRKARKELEK